MRISDPVLARFNSDNYGEIINGPKTYDAIIEALKNGTSVIIGWNDGGFNHLDIMFTIRPVQAGLLQRGMSGRTDLFVSISHFGFFGFELNGARKYPDYITEKLGVFADITTEKLAELINAICERLEKQ